MKVIKMFLLIVLVCFAVTGCSQKASKVSDSDAVDFVQQATYVQDIRTGVCYAVIASRSQGDFSQAGMSFTYVPCEKVEKYLVNK